MQRATDREIELKLAIRPADAAAFRRLPLLRDMGVGKPQRLKLFNVYFDTPALALKARAMALRLRKSGGKWLQTLKTAGVATGGLHQRGEWEFPLRLPQLDLALFRETPLATLPQRQDLHLTLAPAFTTDFQRTTWLLEISPGERVEVALDQGVIRCGDTHASISEVEIELLEGSASTVFDVAIALAGQIALRPDSISKAERGFRLFKPETLLPRHAGAVELKRKWLPHQAMQAIAAGCLDHFDANVEGAITSDDPEHIHQLRVALRRLRSAMRIVKAANTESMVGELQWLTGLLGQARDWDVLMTKTLPALLDGYADAGTSKALIAAGERRRADARDAARDALGSARAAQMVLSVGRWLHEPGGLELPVHASADDDVQTPAAVSLSRLASHEVRRRHRRLLRAAGKNGDELANMTREARHGVRIDAKRLRYAVDFFASLYDKKRVECYGKVLGEIQDLLGALNDDAIAMDLVESLAPPKQFTDFAKGWMAARLQTQVGEVERHLAALKKARRFWK